MLDLPQIDIYLSMAINALVEAGSFKIGALEWIEPKRADMTDDEEEAAGFDMYFVEDIFKVAARFLYSNSKNQSSW